MDGEELDVEALEFLGERPPFPLPVFCKKAIGSTAQGELELVRNQIKMVRECRPLYEKERASQFKDVTTLRSKMAKDKQQNGRNRLEAMPNWLRYTSQVQWLSPDARLADRRDEFAFACGGLVSLATLIPKGWADPAILRAEMAAPGDDATTLLRSMNAITAKATPRLAVASSAA